MEACGGVGGEGRKRGRVKDGGEEREPEAKRRMSPWSAAAASAAAQHPHPASRIYRVSRASGGKDRHSKVYTAKGIRDRRVRLSVATAIQFYDLQDRLGYDQPSKAIEWLIKAAADAIDKLPELDAAAGFPPHPASSNIVKDHHHQQQALLLPDQEQQQQVATGSGCSSTSETSKGSVLSLSRSESRVKARERARERSAAAKDKDTADDAAAKDASTARHRAGAAATTAASFTELLTGMAAAAAATEHKQPLPVASSWPPMAVAATTADYIGFAHQPPPRKAGGAAHAFASPAPHLMAAAAPAQHFGGGAVTVAAGAGDAEMTHFSFLQDHFMPVHAAPASGPAAAADYNLNFSMSSALVGVNNSRGTLQSNSHISSGHHHHHHQLQRLSSSTPALEAPPNIPFLFSPAPAAAAADTQFAAFQLWNGFHHADMKEKGKN